MKRLVINLPMLLKTTASSARWPTHQSRASCHMSRLAWSEKPSGPQTRLHKNQAIVEGPPTSQPLWYVSVCHQVMLVVHCVSICHHAMLIDDNPALLPRMGPILHCGWRAIDDVCPAPLPFSTHCCSCCGASVTDRCAARRPD